MSKYVTKAMEVDQIFYKYVPIQTALLILKNGTIKFPTPLEINDPFEFHTGFLYNDFDEKERLSQVKSLLKEYSLVHLKELDTITTEYIDEGFVDIRTNFFEKFRNNTGVFCGSKSFCNSLLWSYYADAHKGVCLGFKFPAINTMNCFFSEVNYVSEIIPLKIAMTKETQDDDILAIHYWLCTKSSQWRHEEELRGIKLLENGLFPFNKNYLVELYYGIGITEENKVAINKVLAENEYPVQHVLQMEINPGTFALRCKIKS